MHQRARDVVIAHRGAGALIGRRIGDRLHRQQLGAGIVDKGNAEPRAIGRRDERQFGPACRADALAIDRLAAGDAQRRQRDVEREPRGYAPTRRGRRVSAPRRWPRDGRGGDASASMERRLAPGMCSRRVKSAGLRHDVHSASDPAYPDRHAPATKPDRRTPFCSTAPCCARGSDRARRAGPATFLLDRVVEDMAERLQAVTRGFSDVADIWTPGEAAADR